MMSDKVGKAINEQIHAELTASYTYLAMSAYCERSSFTGAARWLRLQSQEEYGHAMRLFDFMLARHAKVELKNLAFPKSEFESLQDVFETAYAQEQAVSGQIEKLYELAFTEKVYHAAVQLEWFLTEQVEEEKTCREVVTKLRMVKEDPASLLEIDRELGSRTEAESSRRG
jgi:ferritin